MLTLNDGRAELWQWDTGRTLAVDADCSQVHFSNKVFGRSIDVDVADGVAIIPDILLQTDKDLTVWAFVGTAENGYTKISKTFKVNRRNKPADYVFTPQEQIMLKDAIAIVETAKSAANDAIESAKQAEDSSTQAAKSEDAAADSASAAAASAASAERNAEQTATDAKNAADAKVAAAGSADAAAGSANAAASYATASANSATAADSRATEAEVAKQAVSQSAAAADKQATDAAKSATDADRTANSIKDSMAQISENKEAVSQLKDDLANKLPKSPADWEPWTAEEQTAARESMGIPGDYELIEEITVEEDLQVIERSYDLDGNMYEFRSILLISHFPTIAEGRDKITNFIVSAKLNSGKWLSSFVTYGLNAFANITYQLIQNQNGFYNMVFSECTSNKGHLNGYPAKISSSFELGDYIKSIRIETTLSANIYSGSIIKIYGVRA